MNNKKILIINWTSRVLAMILLLLLLVLSFDVFEIEGSIFELIGAFLIHNNRKALILILLGYSASIFSYITWIKTNYKID